MPKISILTISYNQREYLEQNLASVLAQDFDDWEQIILDPGSSDGSRELVASLGDARIKLHAEPDSGPADALNTGLAIASGEIIYYLNSDDELAPGGLKKILEAHESFRDSPLIVSDGWLIDEKGAPIKHVLSDRYSPREYALGRGVVLQQATSFKRRIFDEGLRFNADNRINWDSELLFDAWALGVRPKIVRGDIGYFRLQPDSLTVSGRRADLYKAEVRRLRRSAARNVVDYRILRLSSLLARALKRSRSALYERRNPATFPGLAR